MVLVDTHCHLDCLDLSEYEGSLDNLLKYALEQGVKYFLCVCITLQKFQNMQLIAQNYPNIFLTAGTHPNEGREVVSVEEILSCAKNEKVVGIGETGLDYFRSEGDLEWQRDRFRNHIRAAQKINKPLIVHTRDAQEDTIRILKEESATNVGGVLHCFTETYEMARQALDLGFCISFSGIITFQNAKLLKEVAKKIPLDRILIETDSPYLAPVPYRGKPNIPAYVSFVAQEIANLKGVSVDKVAEQTTHNFFELFRLAQSQGEFVER